MKKYYLYFSLLVLYYCFLKINYNVSEIIRIKYLYTLTLRETIAFMFYQLSNLVFVYLSIMEYISIEKETKIRIGKQGYLSVITKRCILTFFIILFANVAVDFLLFGIYSGLYCLLDSIFLISIILLIHTFFQKKDYQIIISVVLICFIRNIGLALFLS